VILAITGGTGFVGGHLIDLALKRGHKVRALTRRPQPARDGVDWIEGSLETLVALAALCTGAEAVIHVAGVINGDADAFHRGNVLGTAAMLAAAGEAGVPRFIHVSSLAAREPGLSRYGSSKAESEEVLRASAAAWTIVRPPAIYGPGDREMLELFRLARRGLVPLPPGGHLSLIAARDLCRLLLACLDHADSIGRLYEPDDGRPGGWGTVALACAIGKAVGRPSVLPLPLPRRLLLAVSWADVRLRGAKAKLTRDRVDYFCHPDWTAAPHAHPPKALWQAAIATETGLAETAAWYRREGWLR
jgi:uncharacterized protein YbjT (DUF2867 family)